VNGAPTTVAAGTITLTDDATNYVLLNTSGVVAKNTTGFIAGCLPMATVVTASGAISTVTDKRTCGAAGSAGGGASAVPVGAVVAFLKSLTNCPALPDAYVECNGQTLSDGDSVFNGVVIPDLNGCCCADNFRFLRGNAASGSTCGLDAAPDHQHSLAGAQYTAVSYGTDFNALNDCSSSLTYEGGGHDNKPLYYDVVWVLRVK
jgi:hypothetical protein